MVTSLRCNSLSFEYADGLRAVEGVSLEVSGGEFAALIGPNGSGKSTLLRCIAGLARPQQGDVQVDGADVARLKPVERARLIAVVPQFLPSLFDVRVADFVLGGRYALIERWKGPTHVDRDAVHAALQACDAAELGGRSMAELSGGQRQRVVIARAVAQTASIVLVDEPTTSLDPEHQLQVFELLACLAREGRAVLVVTHELNLAGQFARSLSVMHGGRIVARGTPEAILRPDVLNPVYGEHLYFGRTTIDARPFVLPWARATPRRD